MIKYVNEEIDGIRCGRLWLSAAFQHVRDNIDGLNGTAGIQDTDLIFLKALMDSPVMRGLVKVRIYITNTYTHHRIVSIT